MCACLCKSRAIIILSPLNNIRKRLKPFLRKGETSEDTKNQCHLTCLMIRSTRNFKVYCRRTKKILKNGLKKEDKAMFMIRLTTMKSLMLLGKRTRQTVQHTLIHLNRTWWVCKTSWYTGLKANHQEVLLLLWFLVNLLTNMEVLLTQVI